MGTSQVIKQAVERAIANGFGHYDPKDRDESIYSDHLGTSYNWAGSISVKDYAKSGALVYSQQFSLFNHDFAKALWGNDMPSKNTKGRGSGWGIYDSTGYVRDLKYWEYHLQQMVIAEDPIKYLADNI